MQPFAWVLILAGALALVLHPIPGIALIVAGALVGALGRGRR